MSCSHDDVETFEESDDVDGWPAIVRYARCLACGAVARIHMRGGEPEIDWDDDDEVGNNLGNTSDREPSDVG